MTREEAEIYARNMSYEDALFNLTKARAIPYKKATLIKVYELIQALSQEPCDDATLKDIFCMGCEYREQEPCDNAISRQAVLDGLKGCICEEWIKTLFATMVKQLPSVTQKSGKWILTIEDWNKWTCSNCGYVKRTDIHVNIGWKYCPNCGCRMVEPQESEK